MVGTSFRAWGRVDGVVHLSPFRNGVRSVGPRWKANRLLDFDDLDEWAHRLAAALNEHIPVDVGRSVAARSPVYIEDARDILFQLPISSRTAAAPQRALLRE